MFRLFRFRIPACARERSRARHHKSVFSYLNVRSSFVHMAKEILPGAYGVEAYDNGHSDLLNSFSPINKSILGTVRTATDDEYNKVVNDAYNASLQWRKVPAPERGHLVQLIATELRLKKRELGELISKEVGKIRAEGEGEVQEAIDIADFAVGLSRQLYGKTMHSERSNHRMYEQWHPLGVVGVISAFNFPAAVWAWNAMLAVVCGNAVLWKPSEIAPLTAVFINDICRVIAKKAGFPALFSMIIGDGKKYGECIAKDNRIALVSATGSTAMGRSVAQSVANRLGKCLLELGGNNALIVMDDADLDLAVRSIVFGAVGTAGQRCTTTRRLIVHKGLKDKLTDKLVKVYQQIKIGDPLEDGVLMGPLIHDGAVSNYQAAIKDAVSQGGRVLIGGQLIEDLPSNLYVQPTLILADAKMKIVNEETFAPILYIISAKNIEEAIAINNQVSQGLSSAIFTKDLATAEKFLSACGSDCGIANVNIGTSGAEIGGAFGGEKETGGGRESGSDSWKQYMRRQTNTINYGRDLPLAQGIKFEI